MTEASKGTSVKLGEAPVRSVPLPARGALDGFKKDTKAAKEGQEVARPTGWTGGYRACCLMGRTSGGETARLNDPSIPRHPRLFEQEAVAPAELSQPEAIV